MRDSQSSPWLLTYTKSWSHAGWFVLGTPISLETSTWTTKVDSRWKSGNGQHRNSMKVKRESSQALRGWKSKWTRIYFFEMIVQFSTANFVSVRSRDNRSVSPPPGGWRVRWGRLAKCSKCSRSASRPFCLARSAPEEKSAQFSRSRWVQFDPTQTDTSPSHHHVWGVFPCSVGFTGLYMLTRGCYSHEPPGIARMAPLAPGQNSPTWHRCWPLPCHWRSRPHAGLPGVCLRHPGDTGGDPFDKNDPLLVVKHVLQQSGLASPQKAAQHRDWQELCLSLVSLVNIHGYGRRTGAVALVSTHRRGAVVWR